MQQAKHHDSTSSSVRLVALAVGAGGREVRAAHRVEWSRCRHHSCRTASSPPTLPLARRCSASWQRPPWGQHVRRVRPCRPDPARCPRRPVPMAPTASAIEHDLGLGPDGGLGHRRWVAGRPGGVRHRRLVRAHRARRFDLRAVPPRGGRRARSAPSGLMGVTDLGGP